jgi:hypothetical protein
MRWPWQPKVPETSKAPVSRDVQEAVEARRRAEQSLKKAIDRTGEVQEVTSKIKQHRRVNHFAALIAETFKGPP